MQLLVRDMDADAGFGGEGGDADVTQELGHRPPVPRAPDAVALGEEVGRRHHVVKVEGLERGTHGCQGAPMGVKGENDDTQRGRDIRKG